MPGPNNKHGISREGAELGTKPGPDEAEIQEKADRLTKTLREGAELMETADAVREAYTAPWSDGETPWDRLRKIGEALGEPDPGGENPPERVHTPRECPACGSELEPRSVGREVRFGDRVGTVLDEFFYCGRCREEFYAPGQMNAVLRRVLQSYGPAGASSEGER